MIEDFEKLGAFYLGKRVDEASGTLTDELVLYDSKDLTTHAVIVGMTGSGKTGLGIGLIEEAAIDHVPVIAIDPKGDLGNLLLTFPALAPEDFLPWLDPRAALEASLSPEALAAKTAERWRNGLAAWGQSPERIARLREAADFRLFTPGSSAGEPLSVLAQLAPPDVSIDDDAELYREMLDATAAALLAMLGNVDERGPSREQVLLAAILDHAWRDGQGLDLAALIGAIQRPPFTKIGVLDLDAFFPSAERLALAMRLNTLIASPRFQGWLQGESLDVDRLLHSPTGRPQVAVLSIAHLDDAERMLLVTLLLTRLIAWMRRQPGSASLRAVLYMDEVFGFMPPVANPPSKRALLTLLKQARAYGLGVVLATQNPVDLDYKGLANAGTWFVGRLQTERDKERLLDGLRSAAGAEHLADRDLAATLSGLGARRFLLHNVHESAPVVFETRWAMSYLAGPMTREQIKRVTAQRPMQREMPAAATASVSAARAAPLEVGGATRTRPVLAKGIREAFARRSSSEGPSVYAPRLLAAGHIRYASTKPKLDVTQPFLVLAPLASGALHFDWAESEISEETLAEWHAEPEPNAQYMPLPDGISSDRIAAARASLQRWLRENRPVRLLRSATLGVVSEPGETERDFRIRLQHLANERRDAEVAERRSRYAKEFDRLMERLRRGEQTLEREREQAAGQRTDTLVSIGAALLGSLLGRKAPATSAARIGGAVRKIGRAREQSADVKRASENVAALRARIAELEAQLAEEIAQIETRFDAQRETLEQVEVRPKPSDVDVELCGIGWVKVPLPE